MEHLKANCLNYLSCNFTPNKNNELSQNNKYLGQFYMNSPLEKDTVCFSTLKENIKEQSNFNNSIVNRTNINKAELFFNNGESEKALNVLGFKTSTDEAGNITILNGYSPIVVQNGKITQTINDFGINENKLLQNVAKIQGKSVFNENYTPDHYIETENISTTKKSINEADRIKRDFLKLNPKFQQAQKENDTYTLLNMSGYNVEKDEQGQIIFNGNFNLDSHENNKFGFTSFEELGLKNENLLSDIHKINGDLIIRSKNLEYNINPDMEISGKIVCRKNIKDSICSGLIDAEQAAKSYKDKGITEELLKSMAKTGILKSRKIQELQPSTLKNNEVTYYFNEEEISKKFSDDMIDFTLKAQAVNEALENDDDLTAFELLGYDVESDFETDKITINGDYIPYLFNQNSQVSYEIAGINQEKLLKNVVKITGDKISNSNFDPDYIFGINNNGEISETELLNVVLPEIIETNVTPETIKSNPIFQQAVKNNDIFTILQMCGYDVQEDDNGFVSVNGNLEFGQNTNENEDCIPLNKLGLDEQNIIDGINKINGNLTISSNSSIKRLSPNLEVTGTVIHPYEKEDLFSDFYTAEDIAYMCDEESGITKDVVKLLANKGYLNSIQSEISTKSGIYPSLQYFAYEGKNEDFLVEFQKTIECSHDKDLSKIMRSCNEIVNRDNISSFSSPRTSKTKKFIPNEKFPTKNSYHSFVYTVAWALSPKTKETFAALKTPYVGYILHKLKQSEDILKQYQEGKITEEEKNESLEKLELTDREKGNLGIYLKEAWAQAGTKEFNQAKSKACIIAKQYLESGMEKINNDTILDAIKRWESDQEFKKNLENVA